MKSIKNTTLKRIITYLGTSLLVITMIQTNQSVKADTVESSANSSQQIVPTDQNLLDQDNNWTNSNSNQVDDSTKNSHQAKIEAKRQKIVKTATKNLGKPYVWGATGPNSFDCSGLAQYVYRKAVNVTLPRTTYTQVAYGKKVSMNHLKKGDLLFWGSKSAPYHVGIYVGNGDYIHASTPQTGVIKSHISTSYYPALAKRILK